MLLYHTPTSPYVRKVLVFAHEVGLAGRIETTFLRPSPLQPDARLSRDNPLSKIPALVRDDGSVLYDSAVICEYLDSLHAGHPLFPPAGEARWQALRVAALCDGILDAGVAVFYEQHQRPPEIQWGTWVNGQVQKALQGLDALENDAASFGPEVHIGQVCAAATIGWLEFRNVLGDIRSGRPALFTWFDTFRQRPSMQATEPVG